MWILRCADPGGFWNSAAGGILGSTRPTREACKERGISVVNARWPRQGDGSISQLRHIKKHWLVVWNMNFMTFHILGIVVPTDFHIFQRG